MVQFLMISAQVEQKTVRCGLMFEMSRVLLRQSGTFM